MIRGVVFDMDGVLFDTEHFGLGCLLEAAHEQGIPMTPEQVHQVLGFSRSAYLAQYTQWFGPRDYDRMLRRWADLIFEKIRLEGMPQKKGMPRVLHQLKEMGIRIALATSNDRYVVDHYFKSANLVGVMDAIVTGEDVTRSKPAPDIYLEAARQLGLSPGECVGVEDSYNGVKAIRAAGMHCIMIPDLKPYTPEIAPFVDQCLEDLTQLIPALSKKG